MCLNFWKIIASTYDGSLFEPEYLKNNYFEKRNPTAIALVVPEISLKPA
jgi:hypothetical protein